MAFTVADLTVVETFVYFMVAWTLVAFWQRLAENIAYNSIGLNREIAYHNFIATFVTTVIFLVLVYYIPIIIRRFESSSSNVHQQSAFDQGSITALELGNLQDIKDTIKELDGIPTQRSQVDPRDHHLRRKKRRR